MKVKSLVKLCINQEVNIEDEHGSLLVPIEVDSNGDVLVEDGYRYSNYEIYENSIVKSIRVNNFMEDTIVITIK